MTIGFHVPSSLTNNALAKGVICTSKLAAKETALLSKCTISISKSAVSETVHAFQGAGKLCSRTLFGSSSHHRSSHGKTTKTDEDTFSVNSSSVSDVESNELNGRSMPMVNHSGPFTQVDNNEDDETKFAANDVRTDYEYSCHDETETDANDDSTKDFEQAHHVIQKKAAKAASSFDYGCGDQTDYGYGETDYGYGESYCTALRSENVDYGYASDDPMPTTPVEARKPARRRNSCVIRRELDNPTAVAEFLIGGPPPMSDKDLANVAAEEGRLIF